MAETATATQETPEQKTIEKLAARLRQFADPFNWQRDNRWSPDRIDLQVDTPAELAQRTLTEAGL